jgi:hypothetical protein
MSSDPTLPDPSIGDSTTVVYTATQDPVPQDPQPSAVQDPQPEPVPEPPAPVVHTNADLDVNPASTATYMVRVQTGSQGEKFIHLENLCAYVAHIKSLKIADLVENCHFSLVSNGVEFEAKQPLSTGVNVLPAEWWPAAKNQNTQVLLYGLPDTVKFLSVEATTTQADFALLSSGRQYDIPLRAGHPLAKTHVIKYQPEYNFLILLRELPQPTSTDKEQIEFIEVDADGDFDDCKSINLNYQDTNKIIEFMQYLPQEQIMRLKVNPLCDLAILSINQPNKIVCFSDGVQPIDYIAGKYINILKFVDGGYIEVSGIASIDALTWSGQFFKTNDFTRRTFLASGALLMDKSDFSL